VAFAHFRHHGALRRAGRRNAEANAGSLARRHGLEALVGVLVRALVVEAASPAIEVTMIQSHGKIDGVTIRLIDRRHFAARERAVEGSRVPFPSTATMNSWRTALKRPKAASANCPSTTTCVSRERVKVSLEPAGAV